MGFSQSKGAATPEIEEIRKETGFTTDQVLRLKKRFNLYDRDGDGLLWREDFLVQPSLMTNPLSNPIINAFFLDEKNAMLDRITFKQFAMVLSRFLPENIVNICKYNTTEEKLKFLFKLFDKDCDGFISRLDLISILAMLIGSQVCGEQLDKIVDQTIMEADADQDGKVSLEEFSKVMAKVNVNQKMTLTF